MERNSETQTLSYGKGMTNVPSDMLSGDSELQESIGFIHKEGEMKPVQDVVQIGNVPYKIMYVHKMADYEMLIAYDGTDKIHCYNIQGVENITSEQEVDSYSLGETYSISGVGNTLVAATSKGLHYLLFKGGTYKDLGTELPVPTMKFKTLATELISKKRTVCALNEIIDYTKMWAKYDDNGDLTEITGYNTPSTPDAEIYYEYHVKKNNADAESSFQDAVRGNVAEGIKKIKEENHFAFPFFVRYALRLYDGSYVRISNPILICPTINRNFHFTPVRYNSETNTYEDCPYDGTNFVTKFMWFPWYSALSYYVRVSNAEEWKDIVKDVVVFATDEVEPFDLTGEYEFRSALEVDGSCYANQVSRKEVQPSLTGEDKEIEFNHYYNFNINTYKARHVIMPVKYKSDDEIIDDLLKKTQFYKLFSLSIEKGEASDVTYKEAPIKQHVVENLTEQEQLETDDYYGWTKTFAKKIFPYNKRINLIGIERKPFGGFGYFMPITSALSSPEVESSSADAAEYEVYTHIVSESMDAWVKSEHTYTALPEMLNSWMYYPDPHATEMRVVKKGTSMGVSLKLRTHPMLNGAYSFGSLPFPRVSQAEYTWQMLILPRVDDTARDVFDSNVYTSEVNNPFVFTASGDNQVGTGKVLGIIANTEAVSQGQFGQYPLIVFTNEGIYGLSVSTDGLYKTSYPVSREACDEDSPLVPTDNMVVFVSKKGLMATTGGQVACLSGLLSGRAAENFVTLGDGRFRDFVKGSLIAYDFRDSLLRIYGKGKTYQYIYNIADKTFAMTDSGIEAQAVVNNYPDNLIQDTGGNIYSLTRKPDINDDEREYDGEIVTRPLKLGGSLTLKSLRKIKHLMNTRQGTVELEIWASNNAREWCQLHSLKGKPWSYFVFKYKLRGFKANDSFSGTVVRVQKRREAFL